MIQQLNFSHSSNCGHYYNNPSVTRLHMPEWSTLGIMAGKSMFGRDGNDLEPEAPVSSLAAAEGFAIVIC